ncbi:MAG: M3 family metallopeptidase [Oligoflexales bacterium]|nr:M3 family metallopeptidase [Oligoflexales bacterium]
MESIWGTTNHLLSVKNSKELRDAYNSVQGEIVSFALMLSQSKTVFDHLISIKNGDEWKKLSGGQQRAIDLRIRSAKLSGMELEGADRERFNEISRELSKLATDFSNNVLDSIKSFSMIIENVDDMAGLPPHYRSMASEAYNRLKPKEAPAGNADSGPWAVTLDGPSYLTFMESSQKRELRKKLYEAHITKASSGEYDNTENIYKILSLRKEMAALLDFGSYAEYSLASKMAEKVSAVDKFSEDLRNASHEFGMEEQKELEDYAKKNGLADKFQNWDTSFFAERLREHRFLFTDEQIKPYFPLPSVLSGLFGLIEKLFNVKVVCKTDEINRWHEDVQYYEVHDSTSNKIAAFFLDPFSRPENKKQGAWMDNCISRGVFKGTLKTPVAYLVINAPPPLKDGPSLLNFRDVETLFHEFGHGLQHMLSTINHLDISGINGIEWDAVELPSQFMENWCYHEPTLMSLTCHFQTGEKLPQELFKKIKDAKNFRSASQMLRQLHLGLIDMELHHRYKGKNTESIFEVNDRIARATVPLPPLKSDRFLCSFTHIFAGGYAAGYYSYKWAEVLSADAFSAFEEAGFDDENKIIEIGKRFRDTVLSLGGSMHPREIFIKFRGREPSIDALLRHNGIKTLSENPEVGR